MGRVEGFGDRFALQWHLDDRCNQACTHCYRSGQVRPTLDEDSRRRLLEDIATFIARRGVAGRIHFAGGEPFVCGQLLELVARARELGLPCRILSNGTLVDDRMAQELARLECHGVQVSLEGSEATHDAIRGKGAFTAALAGLATLRRAGVPATVSMTVHRDNHTEISAIAGLAGRHAQRVYFSRLIPTGRGGSQHETLSVQEWWRAAKRIRAIGSHMEVALRDPTFRPQLAAPWHAARCRAVAGCAAGYRTLTIESDGAIYPCRRLPMPLGKVGEMGLEEAWVHPEMERLRNRDLLEGACGTCSYRWVCGGCRGIPYALNGNPMAEDPQCAWGKLPLTRLRIAAGHARRAVAFAGL